MSNRKVLIAGGGIGGLTAALCLVRNAKTDETNTEVVVFEQASELGEIGAGIQLSPNCTRVLHHLGLEDALLARAFLPEGIQFRNWRSGKVISESQLGGDVVKRYGMPYYHIHRGDLLSVLAEAAAASANISIHTNAEVTGLRQDGLKVEVMTNSGEYSGDALVGADGIHSCVRQQLWGAASPAFTGNIAWRALVPANSLPQGMVRPMSTAWWGPGRHFVHYYVRGGELVNCVCVVEKTGWEVESWTEAGGPAELKSDFAGWHDDVQQLIDAAEPASLAKWALFDRPPMVQWGQGRVTLLGDACHPTLPFMAQGSAMAIEDGAVLAACLAATPEISKAFERYEKLRKPRTAGIQKGSRRNAKMFHLSGVKAWMRNRAVRAAGNRSMDGLYRYNALDVV